MAPGLVFLHGIGGSRDEQSELAAWTEALAVGARAAGHNAFVDRHLYELERRFVCYSDLFEKAGAQGSGGWDSDEGTDEEVVSLLDAMLRDLLDAEQDDEEVRPGLERALKQLHPRGVAMGAGSGVGRAINAATTLLDIRPIRRSSQWLTAKLLIGDLRQVSRYLSSKPPKGHSTMLNEQIQDRLREAVGDKETVVVAHSLGSVVAYETLHTVSPAVPLFMTIGSPLALRTVVLRRVVPYPLRTPKVVGRWLDFSGFPTRCALTRWWSGSVPTARWRACQRSRTTSPG